MVALFLSIKEEPKPLTNGVFSVGKPSVPERNH